MQTRTTLILTLTIIITLAAGSAFGTYSGGTGDPCTPYQIATKADLLALAANTGDYGAYFVLTADIDMQGQVFTTAIIAASNPNPSGNFEGTAFTGTFDGNGHKVTHFTISDGSGDYYYNYLGLFGYIDYGGSVKKLGLENFAISGNYSFYIGGLVGCNYYGSISNCYSTGTVSGYGNVGGLVGINAGTISNCYSTGSVSGSSTVGGLVGENDYYGDGSGIISNCYSTGAVSGSSNSQGVGGLVGYSVGSVSNCYSTGTVTGGSGSSYLGGLVGENEYYYGYDSGIISNCYSTGAVSGSSGSQDVGGLVGYSAGNVSNCYSMSTVTGGIGSSTVGGLVGENEYYGNDSGIISNCYSTGAVSGSSNSQDVGGLVGYSAGSVSNCYSTGTVTGGSGSSYLGGLAGENEYYYGNDSGIISNCYSTGAVSGSSNKVGGLVGYNYSYDSVSGSFWDTETSGQTISTGGTGKTTAEMKTFSTFTSAGWDFASVWAMPLRQYPMLWLRQAGDLNYDGRVDFADFAILAENWLSGE